MLAASTEGITSRFAVPASRLSATARSRITSTSAASPCISPSTSRSGARSRIIAKARRILRAESLSLAPKFECDSSATFGAMPNWVTAWAASRVISVICSAVGSTTMCVSQMNNDPAGRIRQDIA